MGLSTLREKCLNTKFFLFFFFFFSTFSPNKENADQEKLRIWTLFTQWWINSRFKIYAVLIFEQNTSAGRGRA